MELLVSFVGLLHHPHKGPVSEDLEDAKPKQSTGGAFAGNRANQICGPNRILVAIAFSSRCSR